MATRPALRKKQRILFLPGLGGTERMYDNLHASLDQSFGTGRWTSEQLRYPEPGPRESMADFASRLLPEHGISNRKFDFVVGTSFGGMLAQELVIGGQVRTERLVLISPAFTGGDISPVAGMLARMADLVPRFLHRAMRDHLAWVWPLLRIHKRHARELAKMVRELPRGLLFYAARMIRHWRVPPIDLVRIISQGLPERTLLVMGGRDPVISPARVRRWREPDLFFPDGDHFIAITRTDEIAEAMRNMMTPGRRGSNR